MTDEFLYDAVPEVRQRFADSLYQRLSSSEGGPKRRLAWAGVNRRNLGYAAALVVTLTIAVACAREILRPKYVQVGDMWVLEGIPASYVWRFEIPARSSLDVEIVQSREPELIAIGQALTSLPYRLDLPGWLPEGYFLVEEEILPPRYPDWFVSLSWVNSEGERVALWASTGYDAEMRVPRGMWEQLSVGGAPAVLVRGRFPRRPDMSQIGKPVDLPLPTPGPEPVTIEIEYKWEESAGLGLTWHQGGGIIHLQTYGAYLDTEELIRIADSMTR